MPTAEQPLRAAEFSRLFGDAVLGVERPEPARLRLDLRPAPQVAARVAELVTAETQCCSFFQFILRVSGGSLVLDVTVPGGYLDILDAIAATAMSMTSAITSE